MSYQDLVIAIRRQDDAYRSVVLQSPIGTRPEAPFEPPFNPNQTEHLRRWLEAGVGTGGVARNVAMGSPSRPPTRSPTSIGSTLHQTLFAGEIAACFTQSLERARSRGDGLRIRLVFGMGEDRPDYLASLPWELTCPPDTRSFLALGEDTSLVRELDVPVATDQVSLVRPVRILAMLAQPNDHRALDLETEALRLKERWADDPGVEVEIDDGACFRNLRHRLQDGRFNIFHFMGHGTFAPSSGEGALVFVDGDGRGDPTSGFSLATNLRGLPNLQFVFLNACRTGELPHRDGHNPFDGVASALLESGQKAVLAMQIAVSDRSAIEFSDAFYGGLARNQSVESAVFAGRLAMFNEAGGKSFEWATPVLFMNSPSGQSFSLPHTTPDLPGASTRDLSNLHRVGVVSMRHPIETIEDRVDDLLDLTGPFEDRYIDRGDTWNAFLFPELRRFLIAHARRHSSFLLQLDALTSLAFAAGYCLDAKSGVAITIRQRTHRWGAVRWQAAESTTDRGAGWRFASRPIRSSGHDVAVAVGVSRPVLDDVALYVERSLPRVGRILAATVDPEPSQAAIADGAHAATLAQSLSNEIEARSIEERAGTLHLFIAGPNVFTFALGQLGHGFGPTQLYEYDFKTRKTGAYTPSFHLPPG